MCGGTLLGLGDRTMVKDDVVGAGLQGNAGGLCVLNIVQNLKKHMFRENPRRARSVGSTLEKKCISFFPTGQANCG